MSEAAEKIEVREHFDVDNDMKAEWCLSKIRKVRADQKNEVSELQRQMQFYLDQIDMINAKADEEVKFFEHLLRPYFNERVDSGFAKAAKTQISYKLPTGKMMLKKRDPNYDTKDGAFLQWLKSNNMVDFIEVKESAKWGEFKKTLKGKDGNIPTALDESGVLRVVDKNGEFVPGVKVTPVDDEFIVEAE